MERERHQKKYSKIFASFCIAQVTVGSSLTSPENTQLILSLRKGSGRWLESTLGRRISSRVEAKARRRALGLGGSAGAFLAFGLTPLAGLASAPPARADGLDAIIDPILNSILSSVTSFDALLGIDPSALGDLALPATDAAAVAPSGWEALFGDLTNPVSDVGTAASVADSTSTTFLAGHGAGLD